MFAIIPDDAGDGTRYGLRTYELRYTDRREVEIRCFLDKRMVVTSVADTGTGMEVDVLERLFDPFYTTKPTGKGTGLGLSVSRNIVAEVGGTLTASNREEGGALFEVQLPIESAALEGEGEANSSREATP